MGQMIFCWLKESLSLSYRVFILSSLPDQSAFATFPGENGKIAFVRIVEGNEEIYAINADGSGQTRLTNHPSGDTYPDWSPDGTKIAFSGRVNSATGIFVMNANEGSDQTLLSTDPRDSDPDWESIMPPPPPADTTPPVLTVPGDIVVEDSGKKGGGQQVIYSVIAQDNVDSTATLQGDGTTIIQDDVGGNIIISCEPPSGSTFPVGETVVTCSAEDLVGNRADEKSFTITVQDTTAPDVEITEASDKRNGRGEIAEAVLQTCDTSK
jgi:WD40-like Beta Propeller Repeat/HYR domain